MERRKDSRRSDRSERRQSVDESSPLRRDTTYRRIKVKDRRYYPKQHVQTCYTALVHKFIIKMNARRECKNFVFDLSLALENRY